MLLLNTTALVVVALTRGAAHSMHTAQRTTTSWALATQGIEAAVAASCRVGTASGVDTRATVVASWTDRMLSGWSERDVQVAMTRSPLTGAAPATLSMRAARNCP